MFGLGYQVCFFRAKLCFVKINNDRNCCFQEEVTSKIYAEKVAQKMGSHVSDSENIYSYIYSPSSKIKSQFNYCHLVSMLV